MAREISYIEKRCESLGNKNIELRNKLVTLNSLPADSNYGRQNFTIPSKEQVVRATRKDMRDFAQNGTRHFAKKQKIATTLGMNQAHK